MTEKRPDAGPCGKPHNRRCPICGRTWRDEGDTVASGACLQCGSTPDSWERAPDGIDFRSQHTEKGRPT